MPDARAGIQRLEVLIGEWTMEATFPGAGPVGGGHAVFEWILDGQYVQQRTSVPHPDAPDCVMVIGVDRAGGGYIQHYFDSRGVTRVYAMTLGDQGWTLVRDASDFSPLDFSQRFSSTFSEDRRTIDGHWETRSGSSDWRRDFGLTYRRV
ncbi:MAG TPA: hypothetical protein VKG62_03865 [Solirubrobacteraceae bacterium]|nr:hypothetical protein [Solirubrobacteraceae bacterium]